MKPLHTKKQRDTRRINWNILRAKGIVSNARGIINESFNPTVRRLARQIEITAGTLAEALKVDERQTIRRSQNDRANKSSDV